MNDDELDESPIDIDSLGWEVDAAPEGFAARVAGVHSGDAPVVGPQATAWWSGNVGRIAIAAAVVLVSLPLIAWLLARGPVSDAVATTELQTIHLHDRGVAVAQAGTVMRWQVEPDGTTVVEQDAGRVFYRVDHGEAFAVKTPTGTVTVTGTCFEVDVVTPMDIKKTAIKSGTLGAVLATALVVTVYEGGVVLANDKGSVDVAAGQRAAASDGAAPHRYSDDDDGRSSPESQDGSGGRVALGGVIAAGAGSADPAAHVRRQARDIDRLKAEKDAQYTEIEQLRKQVQDLGGEPTAAGPEAAKAKAKRCATESRTPDCPFLDPGPETLAEMARCATVKIDHPPFLDDVERPDVAEYAKNMGLTSEDDVAAMQAAADTHYDAYSGELRKMFIDLGGSEELAADASPSTMVAFIGDQLDPDEVATAQRRIARERAGLIEPPEDLEAVSMGERMFRLNAELGNDFEAHLAKGLGPERARALRSIKDGWPGSTGVHSGRCRDDL